VIVWIQEKLHQGTDCRNGRKYYWSDRSKKAEGGCVYGTFEKHGRVREFSAKRMGTAILDAVTTTTSTIESKLGY